MLHGVLSGRQSNSANSHINKNLSCYYLILFFVVIKIGLNLFAIQHFGLQRDELLYITLGDHLDWGYKEIPPFIAFLGRISTSVFGSAFFASRIFSTVFCGLVTWFTGLMVLEFGGKKFAIALACLCTIVSPAFAASGYLFEPIVFDQFWWLFSAWLIARYINTQNLKYIYLTGLATGMGMLTKYSMVFFIVALILGLVATKQRKIVWNKHVLYAASIALLIFLPNLAWEITHHFPVITQMNELRGEQLSAITPIEFVIQQLLVNSIALFVWLAGIWFLLFAPALQKFRFMAVTYLLLFLFLLIMAGKNYYILGAYPMLFAAGGYAIEKWIGKSTLHLRAAALALLVIPNLVIFPMALPVFSLNQTIAIYRFESRVMPFLLFETKWDDNRLHPVTQNYGDMIGWNEMVTKVAWVYNNLSPDQRKHTQIYADNYGEASSLHLYGKRYHLPDAISLNSSFSMWAPPKLQADYIIYVDEKGGRNVEKFRADAASCSKIDEVTDPLAVEKGTGIFLIAHPKTAFNNIYHRQFEATQFR
ncbi:MAG TPA: glycosyltransferase family 39 protein [Mucilaginibacter sp.]|nr:glycosyltransferase family 39 protein [Mucilaginibacter sp.]